jgi:[protein-PII] uridylyltransferase
MRAPRLRPTRIEHVVDGVKLRAQLTAAALDAAGDEAAQRGQALQILRAALFRGRMIAKERLENGAGGIETARLLSAVTDEVVTALYDFTTVHLFRARNPTEGERLALMAVGGYGRGALAPFSDIDLLFLRPYKPTAHTESVIEFMLYALWDLGFKVGHASRTIEECIRLSRQDFTIRTSILEARRLAGDERLADELVRRFRQDVVKGTAAEFVAAKLKERDERHSRAGASRYLVEPNVKEGKGGLRDLHTLFWIAQYLHPAEATDGVVQLELFERREVAAFVRAFEFLWAVRSHLHFATGRAEERLSFDLQPEIARRMGYGDRGDAPAVERFMRRYFMIAREVGSLTRAFCAKLEAEQAKKRPEGLSRFLPSRKAARKPLDAPGFHLEGGRLDVDGVKTFEQDPVNLLRLFRLADELNVDLHPDAFTAVTRSLRLITPKLRRDPAAAQAFLDVLARGRSTYRTLSLMNDSGVLGRFIPEFGHIVAQMQFNMYHSYTVDEHTLRAVGVIADIAQGGLKEDHPLSVAVMPLISDREALFLAMLLHDTGKGGVGGQERAGARAARAACERLGLDRQRVELICWLVEHHLVLSDFAQKRDVSDPRTAEAFARIVQTPERLRLLLVLTVADIRAVGPGVFNGWKGQLMRELYASTERRFRGGRVGELDIIHEDQSAERARAALIARDPLAADFAGNIEDAFFSAFTLDEQASHAALVRRAREQGPSASAHLHADLNAAEVAVAVGDRQGLFADLATALSALGADIVGAKVFTSRAGQALDIFFVQDNAGLPYGQDDPGKLERLARALEAAARGEQVRETPHTRLDLSRAGAFDIAPTVVVDADASEDCTVVETSGKDRPGLLGALAHSIARLGLSIQSAHIDNYGERAVDAFYLQEKGGKLSARTIQCLKAALMEVLGEVEANAPARGLTLERARASVAR